MKKLSLAYLFAASGLLLFGMIWAARSGVANSAATTSDFMVEYPVPFADGDPLNIVVESPGRVWFTMPEANAIGSLVVTSTVDYEFEKIEALTPNSRPYDLAFDGESIWFTEYAANRIGRYNVGTKTLVEYTIPVTGTVQTSDSRPTGITVAPSGDVWFVEQKGNDLGRFDPDAGSDPFTIFPFGMAGALFEDIAAVDDNNIWFTAPGINRVVNFLPGTETFLPLLVAVPPDPPVAPLGIAIGQSGFPWVTIPAEDKIMAFVPGTLTLWRSYSLKMTGSVPTGIAYSEANGNHLIWFAENASGDVGTLTVGASGRELSLRRHPLASTGSHPFGVALGPDAHLWIADTGGVSIAEWRPPYLNDLFLPILSRQ